MLTACRLLYRARYKQIGVEKRSVRLKRLGLILVLGLLGIAGCGGTTSTVKTVTVSSSAAASSSSTPSSSASTSSTAAAPAPQFFHGSGQQDLGTIVVPTDSTISWNCPSCAGTNFIINNANSDANNIPTNGLNQTQGVDPIPAGTYHTVVVDTTGGPWTVAVGATAPVPTGAATPSGSPQSQAQPSTQGAYVSCDPNVAVSGADCRLAENTFFEYWSHHGETTVSVYDPTAQTFSTVNCNSSGDIICTTDQGATVRFSQSSIDSYTQSQADRYARSHNVGH